MLRGKVKWYSSEKGFGFLTHTVGDRHEDYFFHISAVVGPDAPDQGDLVSFREKESKKGLAADDVRIVERARDQGPVYENKKEARAERRDDRVECKHCGKRMVPRIKFSKGEPVARLCPFCMKSQEGCFIATAAFNGDDHLTVETLRQFRDAVLLRSESGQKCVVAYYSVSPRIARWVDRNSLSKPLIRITLTLVAAAVRVLVDCLRKTR